MHPYSTGYETQINKLSDIESYEFLCVASV
jgi:hypothetical protein